MNNHSKYKVNENGIEYHVLEFTFSEKNDEKILNKFINQYEYTILINNDYLYSNKKYYKNGLSHNIFEHADILAYKETNEIINELYYLDDIDFSKSQWLIKKRQVKLQKLKILTTD